MASFRPGLDAMLRHCLPGVAAVLVSTTPMPIRASGLDLTRSLGDPGIRWLAVHVVAPECLECVNEAPRWEALRRQYAAKGLRTVVVMLPDEQGNCAAPAWRPDAVLCDTEGRAADLLTIGEDHPGVFPLRKEARVTVALGAPQRAFLWSWTGQHAVSGGTVADVARELTALDRTNPRVVVDARDSKNRDSPMVKAALSTALSGLQKLSLVPPAQEARLLEESGAGWDAPASGLGRGRRGPVTAGYVMRAQVERVPGGERLRLSLWTSGRPTLVGTTTVAWSSRTPARVDAAVAELVAKVQSPAETPKDERRPIGGNALTMVHVPGGTFAMGCPERPMGDCPADEAPQRLTELAPFEVDRTEVTVDEYAACVRTGRCETPVTLGAGCNWGKAARARHPMNCVSWDQALAFCRARGGRLPSEAEWEKSARGTDGRLYPWGNAPRSCAGTANDAACAREPTTTAVGAKPDEASAYGVLDLAGNVAEWVADAAELPSGGTAIDPGAVYRVVKGSSYVDLSDHWTVPARQQSLARMQSAAVGFRCVQAAH